MGTHECVGGGSEQTQTARKDGSGKLNDKQTAVDGEAGIDGELDPRAILDVVEDGQPLLVVTVQELVNELVLLVVELVQAFGRAPLVLGAELGLVDLAFMLREAKRIVCEALNSSSPGGIVCACRRDSSSDNDILDLLGGSAGIPRSTDA